MGEQPPRGRCRTARRRSRRRRFRCRGRACGAFVGRICYNAAFSAIARGTGMPTVRVKENEPFEVALRRFKRTVEKTGLLTELRAREFYEKPTAGAQAQARRRGQAPLQAPAQPDAAAEAVLGLGSRLDRSAAPRCIAGGVCVSDRRVHHDPQGTHHRRHEGRDARQGRARACRRDAPAARRDQAARGRRAHRARPTPTCSASSRR